MPDTPPERRQCPTREDGDDTLIVHWITPSECQGRQDRRYHKCGDCVHRANAASGHATKRYVVPALPKLQRPLSPAAPASGAVTPAGA